VAAEAAPEPGGGAIDSKLSAPAIVARDLTASYGSHPIWARGTFAMPSGSFTAILGPNGAGKSTLIRMILGQLPPAGGRLEVLGEPPRRGNPNIGYVPQGSTFDPELSIRGSDFVGLGVDGHRWGVRLGGRSGVAAEVGTAIDAVGASDYADRPLGSLSGGEQQRLLLAQALVGRPRLLLMDEPLSHLDVRNQIAIVQLISEVAKERGLTVLLIAHDVNLLLPHIDLVLYVAHGRLAIGKPSEIISSQRLTEIYSSPVEVLTDSRGRVFVVGLEEEVSHPHA
jgi:zinc/manganese transport system ATP-binding protein